MSPNVAGMSYVVGRWARMEQSAGLAAKTFSGSFDAILWRLKIFIEIIKDIFHLHPPHLHHCLHSLGFYLHRLPLAKMIASRLSRAVCPDLLATQELD